MQDPVERAQERSHTYCAPTKIAGCGFLREKTTKTSFPSAYTSCEIVSPSSSSDLALALALDTHLDGDLVGKHGDQVLVLVGGQHLIVVMRHQRDCLVIDLAQLTLVIKMKFAVEIED